MTATISASVELGIGEHGVHILVILLPTAYLLLLALREVRHAHLDAVALADRRLRRWFSAAVAAAVTTTVFCVLIGIASLGLSLPTAVVAGCIAAACVVWAIGVSRSPTQSTLRVGLVGAAAVTALWGITLAAGPVGVGAGAGWLLAWAPLVSGTIACISAAVVFRLLPEQEPQSEVLASAGQR